MRKGDRVTLKNFMPRSVELSGLKGQTYARNHKGDETPMQSRHAILVSDGTTHSAKYLALPPLSPQFSRIALILMSINQN